MRPYTPETAADYVIGKVAKVMRHLDEKEADRLLNDCAQRLLARLATRNGMRIEFNDIYDVLSGHRLSSVEAWHSGVPPLTDGKCDE
jgi:hypothetical protein